MIQIIVYSALVSIFTLVQTSTGNPGPGFGHNTPPVFDFKREWLITENEAIGSRVITVRARDAERDPIVYGIEPAVYLDGSNYFTINPKSGDVILKESLIGKAGNDYYLYVTANDGYQTAKIETFVRILPSDDQDASPGIATAVGASNGSDFHVAGRPISSPDRRHPSFPATFNVPPSPPKRPKNPYFAIATPQRPATRAPKNPQPNILPETAGTTTTTGTAGQPVPTQETPAAGEPPAVDDTATNGTTRGTDGPGLDVHGPGGSRGPSATPTDRHSYRFDPMNPQLLSMMVLVVLFCVVVIALWLLQQRFNRRSHQEIIKSLSQKLPASKTNSAETTISSELNYNGAYFHQIRAAKASSNRYESAEAPTAPPFILPTSKEDSRWEFPRYKLNFMDIVGEGCFGQVWRCEAKDIRGPDTGSAIVAVKTLKKNASEREKKDILQELEIMKMLAIEPHPNVVQLLAVCADAEPVFLVMEFVPLGKLQSYLRDSRAGQNDLTSRDLTSFAYQVAKGMEYISCKGIIHRDLAARNILVDANKTCKIADFGFARDVIASHTYERKSEGRLPIRWMAPESLYDNQYTTKSDVWSFGILGWEIVTLGSTPYPGLGAQEVMKRVRDGYRLEKPEHCKREMYNVLFYCWDKDPKLRPSFRECVDMLDKLLISENDYIELERFPEHAYYNIFNNLSGEKL